MGVSYLLALLLAAVSWLQAAPSESSEEKRVAGSQPRIRVVALLCGALCGLFLCERMAIEIGGQFQGPMPPWFAGLPLPFFVDLPEYPNHTSPALVSLAQLCALGQAATLWTLFLALRGRNSVPRAVYAILALTACGLFAICAGSRTLGSSDLYLYVGLTYATPNAYNPGQAPFSGDHAVVNAIWGLPLFASAYGPLWIAMSKLVVACGHSLAQQLNALRALEAIALVVCVILVAALRRSVADVALLAVNPALYNQYVVDGHNDLCAVVLVLAAALLSRRFWLALPLAVAAGLIKLPFLAVAALALCVPGSSLRRRLAFAAAVATVTFALSILFGGSNYLHSLAAAYARHPQAIGAFEWSLHLLVVAVALSAVGLALTRGRFVPGASWSFAGLAQFPLPWYLGWGIPYAILPENVAAPFLATLPIAAYELNTNFDNTWLFVVLRAVLVSTLVGMLAYRLRPRVLRPKAL